MKFKKPFEYDYKKHKQIAMRQARRLKLSNRENKDAKSKVSY